MKLENIIKLIVKDKALSPQEIEKTIVAKYSNDLENDSRLLQKIFFIAKNNSSFFYNKENNQVLLTQKIIKINKQNYDVKNYIKVESKCSLCWKYLIAILLISLVFGVITSKFEAIITVALMLLIHSPPVWFALSKKSFIGSIISLIPSMIALVIIFYGFTCGSGCFSGLFLLPSLSLSFIMFFIWLFIK